MKPEHDQGPVSLIWKEEGILSPPPLFEELMAVGSHWRKVIFLNNMVPWWVDHAPIPMNIWGTQIELNGLQK